MRIGWLVLAMAVAGGCKLPSLPGEDPGIPPAPDADVVIPADPGFDVSDPGPPYDPGQPPVPDGVDVPVQWDSGCSPNCWTKVCGPDGCGGTCGTCPEGTACSQDNSQCVVTAVQVPLGGACGRTDKCKPLIETSSYTYPNPAWPGCLNDQCLEGPCLSWVCSRHCVVTKDTLVNGTSEAFPDGIEDADASGSDCAGGQIDPFPGGFSCVETAPEWEDDPGGLCVPLSGFAPCESAKDCPPGETCGFLLVRGFHETRCLANPAGGLGLSGTCGWDPVTGDTVLCDSWACSGHGCTAPCVENGHCLTPGAKCDETVGQCQESGRPCGPDSECSAWTCAEGTVLDDPSGLFTACAPRDCDRDPDCLDPDFYCRHEKAEVNGAGALAKGVCSLQLAGGGELGDYCNEVPGDGIPDLVCQDQAYCQDHSCGAMCTKDQDCDAGGAMACGLLEYPGGPDPFEIQPVPFPVPVCQWIGASGAPCGVKSDCTEGTCTPFVPVESQGFPAVEPRCMSAPLGSLGLGQRCGEAAWGQECDTRHCLLEDPDDNVPGYCSILCRTMDDCPGATAVGPDVVKWTCVGLLFARLGTTWIGDDQYASWCLPVAGDSSLEPCGEGMACANPGETCRSFVRHGAPGSESQVSYLCIHAAKGYGPGELCQPDLGGTDCRSGSCAPTTLSGVGFCTRPCTTDGQCSSLGGGLALCGDRVVIPGEPPAQPVTVKECRLKETCVTCRDDRDCWDGLRCVNLSALPYLDDFRCMPVCETDDDCSDLGEGVLCSDLPAPYETAPDGITRVCAPLVCPG